MSDKMADKKFSNLELLGGAVALMIAVIFLYFHFCYDPVNTRHKRVQREWSKLSRDVKDLKAISAAGAINKDIRRLAARLKKRKQELGRAEDRLAMGTARDKLSMDVILAASESGLWVKDYSPLNADKLRKVTLKQNLCYQRRLYQMTLYGPFSRILGFIKKISRFAGLVTIERIEMEKVQADGHLKTDLLLSI